MLRNTGIFVPECQTNDLAEASASMDEKVRLAAEVWQRSVDACKALRYVTHHYVKYISSSEPDNALYTKLIKWKKVAPNYLQGPELPRVLQSLAETVAAAHESGSCNFL